MHVTARDIAEACGVSRGTVDRALNGRPGINEETRKLIVETAQQMGYRPHFLAQSLVKGRTMTLGLVLFDLRNQFFSKLANAIEGKARELGYFVYLTLTGKEPEKERECIEHLYSRKVDGIILCPVNQGAGYEDYLDKLGIPVLTAGNRLSGTIPFIGINDYAAMQEAVRHIAGLHYERILYVSPPLAYEKKSNIHAQKQRFLGFTAGLEQLGGRMAGTLLCDRNFLPSLDKHLDKAGPKTAIVCSSDIYALDILNHLKAKGIRVPQEVGLMGFDNIDTLKYVEPSLTTVSYPIDTIGALAVECLTEMIAGKKVQAEILLDHRIIPGKSL